MMAGVMLCACKYAYELMPTNTTVLPFSKMVLQRQSSCKAKPLIGGGTANSYTSLLHLGKYA